jgi:hypothetical protein
VRHLDDVCSAQRIGIGLGILRLVKLDVRRDSLK